LLSPFNKIFNQIVKSLSRKNLNNLSLEKSTLEVSKKDSGVSMVDLNKVANNKMSMDRNEENLSASLSFNSDDQSKNVIFRKSSVSMVDKLLPNEKYHLSQLYSDLNEVNLKMDCMFDYVLAVGLVNYSDSLSSNQLNSSEHQSCTSAVLWQYPEQV
jgi:hypothetical protein